MKRKAPDSQEQACVLCRRAHASADICGPKHEKRGLCVHENCLRCFACGERGAAIACQGEGLQPLLPPALCSEHGCVTQFFAPFRSFCWEHRPQQAVPARPQAETTCLICLEPVDDAPSYTTMVCPACKGAWFHRGCIRGQAVHAGFSCFRCPMCKNRRKFLPEMFKMGIPIPLRGPAWEEGGRYRDLYQRHSRCDASQCLYPRGREQAEPTGPWELLLCSSCASRGAHRRCLALGNGTASWECDECAGLGPAKFSGHGVTKAPFSLESSEKVCREGDFASLEQEAVRDHFGKVATRKSMGPAGIQP
ncbi:PHD finger protein 7-like [Struthio camelus]|uniref:PHD finger protein 7-like n=1 Tax=Struthio camelus TaxID=8801 RepID=UPI003603EF0A